VLIGIAVSGREVANGPPANPDATASRMYREIASPYCPGMSLSSCPSEGAFLLKRRIRDRLTTQSPETVMAELVAEFGPEISGVTPKKGLGLLAWIAPFVGLVLGGLGVAIWTRRSAARAGAGTVRPPSAAEDAKPNDADLERLTAALRADG
jgi:cytochrome c-type biogenesis protein CcmH/NrfF